MVWGPGGWGWVRPQVTIPFIFGDPRNPNHQPEPPIPDSCRFENISHGNNAPLTVQNWKGYTVYILVPLKEVWPLYITVFILVFHKRWRQCWFQSNLAKPLRPVVDALLMLWQFWWETIQRDIHKSDLFKNCSLFLSLAKKRDKINSFFRVN